MRNRIGMTLAAILFAGLTPHNAWSACFAGTIGFLSGQAGIYVDHQPIEGAYFVVVQPRDTAGYSPAEVCTYFNVLKKTPGQFQVQHKTCADGTPIALDHNVPLDWIACTAE